MASSRWGWCADDPSLSRLRHGPSPSSADEPLLIYRVTPLSVVQQVNDHSAASYAQKHHRDKSDTLLPTWIIQRQTPSIEVSRYCSGAGFMVHSVRYGKSRPRSLTHGEYTVTNCYQGQTDFSGVSHALDAPGRRRTITVSCPRYTIREGERPCITSSPSGHAGSSWTKRRATSPPASPPPPASWAITRRTSATTSTTRTGPTAWSAGTRGSPTRRSWTASSTRTPIPTGSCSSRRRSSRRSTSSAARRTAGACWSSTPPATRGTC